MLRWTYSVVRWCSDVAVFLWLLMPVTVVGTKATITATPVMRANSPDDLLVRIYPDKAN